MRVSGVFEEILAITLSVSVAPCVNDPEVPVNVNVAVEGDAMGSAESVSSTGVPGIRVIGDGETLTPAGSPLTTTLICDEKPFVLVAESEAEDDVPDCIVTVLGDADREKSPAGLVTVSAA
jgi:hypothetical protein